MIRSTSQPMHNWLFIFSLVLLATDQHLLGATITLPTDSLETWTASDFSIGSPFGPGTFGIVDGTALRLEHGGPVPSDMTIADSVASILAGTWEPSRDDSIYSHGFFRGKVQIASEGTTAHLFMRANDATHSNYQFSANTATGQFSIRANNTLADPPEYVVLAESDPSGQLMEVNEPWWFEGGIVGNQLSFKFWKDGTAEPATPQLLVTDDRLGPMTGTILCTTMWVEGATSPVIGSTTFSNLQFRQIPEPSSFVLASVALISVGILRRLGKSSHSTQVERLTHPNVPKLACNR